MIEPIEKYKKRIKKYKNSQGKLERISSNISILRVAVFILGVASSIFLYKLRLYYWLVISVLVSVILFIYIIYLHKKILYKKKYIAAIILINGKSMERIQGKWKNFIDKGEEFINEEDNYSYDIDIFGENSLFQFINTAVTYSGRKKLAESLREGLKTKEKICDKQIGILEIEKRVTFRQKLIAEGIIAEKTLLNPQRLYEWAKEKNENILTKTDVYVVKIMPVITIIAIGMYVILKNIPSYVPMILLFIQYIILKIIGKNRISVFEMAEKYNEDLKVYRNMLKLIEKQKFKSPYLEGLKAKLFDEENNSADMAIQKLSKIVEAISNRRNLIYSIMNIVLFTDYKLLRKLDEWKKKYGNSIENWIEAVGEIEEVASLSSLKYDNPSWNNPKIENSDPQLEAINMGHPLLIKNGIHNNVIIHEPNSVLLITGSNMSGKSTLLRTVGVNMVLAYAGAPVCAEKFTLSIMELYTCMRINDDLEKNISSFYGEILKIKKIVKAADEGRSIFFLMDEIFKGTNSIDRHSGASILIKQLASKGSIGLVSTHDLELSELENEENSKVLNYHFEEYYKDDKIYFDYKLKRGVSTTRNAVYLMKLAGIKFNIPCKH